MAFSQDLNTSKVRSEPLVNGKTVDEQAQEKKTRRATRASGVLENIPVVLFGVVIFGLWWAIGGKYTIDGAPLLLNSVAGWFHYHPNLRPVTDWHTYLHLCWVPVCVSFVERTSRPDKAIRKPLAWYGILILIAVWLIVSALDFGSTYMAVTTVAPDAWLLTRQVANTPFLAIGWSGITTFLPEAALVAVVKLLFKG
jgi:hypothetical protein